MRFSYREIQKQIIIVVILILLLLDFTYMFWYIEHEIKSASRKDNKLEFVLNNQPSIEFSHQQGFYEDYFELAMYTSSSYTIRYTTDTKEPTWQSQEYTGPIPLGEIASMYGKKSADGTYGIVIRAGLFNGEKLVSAVYSNTYIFGVNIRERHSLPVIFLVADNDDLFGPKGIYTLFDLRGREYEKPIHIDLVNNDGSLELSQDAGVRIFGAAMRGQPLKSLRLTARNEYEIGKDYFNYEFFPGLTSNSADKYPINSFKHLVLRNSGNDYNSTMFRDALMHRISAGAGIDIQQYRPFVVYINGEYWGIMNMREFLNNDYVASHYGLDSSKITIMSNNLYDGGPRFGENDYFKMMSQVRRADMKNPANYEAVNRMLDIDNYIRYCAVQVYLSNNDWPHNNVRSWKFNTYDGQYKADAKLGADGRFRWMLKDTDFGFGLIGQASQDTLGLLISGSELFRNLSKNEQFVRDYINYSCDFINSIFLPDNVINEINNMQLGIAAEIPYHVKKWKDSAGGSVVRWNQNISVMRRFAETRPTYVLMHLKKHFSLKDHVNLSVIKAEGGYVIVNSVDLSKARSFVQDGRWNGVYFPDIPVRITAVPYPGYEFESWQIYSGDAFLEADWTNAANSVILNGNAEIGAIFRKIHPSAQEPSVDTLLPAYPYPVTEAARYRVLMDGELLDKSIRPHIFDGIVYLCIDDLEAKSNLRINIAEDFVIDGKRYISAEKFAESRRSKFYWSDVYQSAIITK